MTMAPAVPVLEARFRAMASDVHVLVFGGGITERELIERSAEFLAEIESTWSRFLPGSDLDRLNLADGHHTPVAPSTIVLLDAMRRGWTLTEGRFDPTMVPSLVLSGYRNRRSGLADASLEPDEYDSAVGLAALHLDPAGGLVALPRGVALDPGGIGKGLAADLLVANLLDQGAAGALVGIGGDLAFGGLPPAPEGWVVDIDDPLAGGTLLRFTVTHIGGVATSSTRSNRWTDPGPDGTVEARHHVIDPATEAPSRTDLAAVTVIAGTGWLAEVAATSLLLVGSSRLAREASRLGELPEFGTGPLDWFAVTNDGRRLAGGALDSPSPTLPSSNPSTIEEPLR